MQSQEKLEANTRDREVADGVFRFGTDRINWYLIEAEDGLTVVDAGLPGHRQQLFDWLDANGYALDDVGAVVLTHADPDHVGFARTLADQGIPVYCHPDDFYLLEDHPNPGDRSNGWVVRNLWRPRHVLSILEMIRDGLTSVEPIHDAEPIADGDVLSVPGTPRVIAVPGHTPGMCALYLEQRDVLLIGDEIFTMNSVDAREGPHQARFTFEDPEQGRRSLDRLEGLGSVVLLPGHGEPWHGDIDEAIELAR